MSKLKTLDQSKVQKINQDNKKPKLNFDLTDKEAIKTTSTKNVALILQHDSNLKGILRFNRFTDEIDVVKDVTLDLTKQGIPKIVLKKGQLNDGVVNDIVLYISVYPDYKVTFKTNLVSQVIDSVARANSYNPVIDYFETCLTKWDKKPRLDDFLQKYLGTDDSEATKLTVRLWFMGAVAKGYNPLTKFDYVLDLVGGQGIGKTTLLREIAPCGFYTDQFNSFTDKDDKAELKNALIVNDDEMTASNKSSFEVVKKFITEQVFRYRPSYGKYIMTFNKGFVMARTTNEVQHLKDKSGDRRFLSIKCDEKRQRVHPVEGLKQDEIDQVWGEAVYLWKHTKDPFKLSPKQEAILADNRQQFLATSEVEDEIKVLLDGQFKDRKFISNQEMRQALLIGLGREVKSKDIKTMRYVMSHMGFEVGASGYDPISKKSSRGFKKM